VIADRDQVEQILFFSAFQSPAPDTPDSLGVTRVAWDSRQEKVVESPLERGEPIRLVTFGGYPSIARAQSVQAQAADCVPVLLWILGSKDYQGAPGRFFLGTITARPDLAPKVFEAAKACTPPMEGKLLPY
jgi:hypothetical protein